ncbi:DUF3365 domain-containing protein [bacterium]|nr:DUF3365 domain-containing protein [bacterium]
MKKSLWVTVLLMVGIIVIHACDNQQASSKESKKQDSETSASADSSINYLKLGKDLAMQAKAGLANKLVKAISEKGSDGAVEFCNIQAMPITDSMSVLLNAHLKRVSDHPRNPANQANDSELEYIKRWKAARAAGTEQAPIAQEIDGKMVGYYPIVTNQLCMQCHGNQ